MSEGKRWAVRRKVLNPSLARAFSSDPAALMVALFAMAASFPQLVRAVYDTDPASPEFAAHYAEQINRLVSHLRG